VTATNGAGSTSANSDPTAVVVSGTPTTTAAGNARPTLRLISVRLVGLRVYARFRACDDSRKLTILATDSRPGRIAYTRRFTTFLVSSHCAAFTRNWLRVPRFRGHGRYTVTLRAIDSSGRASVAVRKIFFL
jgi:hypothetical protein